MAVMKSALIVLMCWVSGVVLGSTPAPAPSLSEKESEKEATRLLEAADILTDEVRMTGALQILSPDDRETESMPAHSEAEFQRRNEELHRMTTELSGLVKKLQTLREQQAKAPDDEGLRGEIAQVKTEYLHKLRHYNSARIPRSKLLYEGDLPAEEMPWERGDGGALSVVFRHNGKEMQVRDEEAAAVREFLDEHASEWIRGDQYSTEGMLNQLVFAGSVTVCKANGYCRTYTIVYGEGLRWGNCYLPTDGVCCDNLFRTIQSRYIRGVSKLPLPPEAQNQQTKHTP